MFRRPFLLLFLGVACSDPETPNPPVTTTCESSACRFDSSSRACRSAPGAAAWPATAQWSALGDSEVSPISERVLLEDGSEQRVSPAMIAVDANDRLIIARVKELLPHGLVVSRREGGAWIDFGTAAAAEDPAEGLLGFDFAIDGSGDPVVLWESLDDMLVSTIRVRTWSEDQWVELGDYVERVRSPQNEMLAVTSTGAVFVAVEKTDRLDVRRWDGAAWVDVGGGFVDCAPRCMLADFAVDPLGRPHVLYRDDGHFTLEYWDGAMWLELGSSADLGPSLGFEGGGGRLAIDALGHPTVVLDALEVLQWDGAAWIALPSLGAPDPQDRAQLALDSNGAPLVWWGHELSESTLRAYNGTSWESAGLEASAFRMNAGSRRAMAVDSTGRLILSGIGDGPAFLIREGGAWKTLDDRSTPHGLGGRGPNQYRELLLGAAGEAVLTWSEDLETQTRFASATWNGSSWDALPPITRPGRFVKLFGAVLAVDGLLRLAVEDCGTSSCFEQRSATILRWEGERWSALAPNAGTFGRRLDQLHFTLDDTGEPIAAWTEAGGDVQNRVDPQLVVARHRGSSWDELARIPSGTEQFDVVTDGCGAAIVAHEDAPDGENVIITVLRVSESGVETLESPFSESEDFKLDLATDSTGTPWILVAWEDDQHRPQLEIGRWMGATWAPIEAPLVPETISAILSPQLLFDSADQPMIAFSATSLGPSPEDRYYGDEILLWRWNGTTWTGVSGSDALGGISNSAPLSHSPSFAARDGAICASWSEHVRGGEEQILLRCIEE